MFLDFKREVFDNQDLERYLINNNINLPEFRTAVIALFIDNDNNIYLQRRGPKSRDEVGMLEDIGGAVEEDDLTFRDALIREIKEEAGDKLDYNIKDLVGGCLINKYDSRTDSYVNWLFLLYECAYVSGEFLCNEEGKALGYEKYKYDNLPKEEVALSTLSFWEYYYNKKRD